MNTRGFFLTTKDMLCIAILAVVGVTIVFFKLASGLERWLRPT